MRWVLVLLGLVSLSVCEKTAQVTRTQLYVARSLDPEATETRTVRTTSGEMATLVVKRRDGKRLPPPPPHPDNFPKAGSNNIDPQSTNRSAKSDLLVPEPVVIRSTPVLVKGEQHDWKRGKSLMKIDSDGIPVITGVRMPDTEEDKKQVWRNARVIKGVLVPYEKSQEKNTAFEKPVPEFKSTSKIEWLKMEPITRPIQPVTQENLWYKYAESPQMTHKPTMFDQSGPQVWKPAVYPQEPLRLTPQQIQTASENNYQTDKILQYIKSVNREEVMNRQRQTLGNSRGSRGMRDTPKMEARVLHTPGATVYPTSLLYAPPSSQNGRVRVEEGVRTPILQYAHPELGVQAALVAPTEDDIDNGNFGRDKALAYFAHDIHSDRSPFAFEPGLEDEARVEDYSENDKRSNNGYSHRPKKTLSYFYNDQAIPYSGKHYGKYNSYKDHYNQKYNDYVDRRPFWEKLGDTIKEHVEYGMGRVQDITRPVMEPLVEASHKISENLGFNSGTRDLNAFKEKLGVAGSNSMLLPAIGLVAGGAALGLGAVAVGRFLDVDMLKRSSNGVNNYDDLPLEHKRALLAIAQGHSRHRRSLEEQDLQHVEIVQPAGVSGIHESAWASTPCAKLVFCQVLVSQSHDDVDFMEKKMATYLRMLGGVVGNEVGPHLDDVMRAIRRRDCSVFHCPASPFPR